MTFIELKSGKSVEGDEIKAYKTEKKANSYIYLLAGVHGDEVEGVYLLDQLFTWLKEQDELKKDIVVIPILNVDGYRSGNRTNAHGVDLNRNLPASNWTEVPREEKYNPGEKPLSEPENVFLDKLFQKFPPKFILSFHSWKPFINYNGDCLEQAEILAKSNHYPIHSDIEGHPTPGSLGHYGVEKYDSPVLTFEAPLIADGITLKEIWEENREGFLNLLKSETI